MSGPNGLQQFAVQRVAAGETPLWQYGLTTLVALLAAGAGIAAIVNLINKRRTRVATHLDVEPTPLYTFEMRGTNATLTPRELVRELEPSVFPNAISPVVIIQVTNRSDAALSINEMRYRSSQVQKLDSQKDGDSVQLLYVKFVESEGVREEVERMHRLHAVEQRGSYVSYACAADSVGPLAERLNLDPRVVTAFVDVTGAPHTEWQTSETVDLLVDTAGQWSVPVSMIIEPNASVTLKYRVGATKSVRATIEFELLLNSEKHVGVGSIKVELIVPAFVTVTASWETGGGGEK